MRKLGLIFLTIILTTLVFSGCKTDGWEYPFNGKNLNGWKQLNGNAKYEVIDGVIVGTVTDEVNNSFLVSEKNYADFILEVDILLVGSSNSGVNFRSHSNPDYLEGKVYGYQSEVDPSERAWSGGVYDENRRQWLYPLDLNPTAKTAFKMDEWNRYRIECIGTSIRTWINDIPTAHVIDELDSTGFIGLPVHYAKTKEMLNCQVKWKNLRIKTKNLVPSPAENIYVANYIPNQLSEVEKLQGFQLLFDGETSQGWKSIHSDAFPEKGWEVKNGNLSILENNGDELQKGGDIVSTEKFGAFHLKFEFNLNEGANSGIKYCTGNNGPSIGLEYQVIDDKNYEGLGAKQTLASLYDLIPAQTEPRFVKPPGEWNQAQIVLSPENKIEHWLNGRKVVDCVKGDSIFNALVKESKFAKYEGFALAEKAPILIQDHNHTVHFRSIKIKVLN